MHRSFGKLILHLSIGCWIDGKLHTIAVNSTPPILTFTFLPVLSKPSFIAICQRVALGHQAINATPPRRALALSIVWVTVTILSTCKCRQETVKTRWASVFEDEG